MEIFDLLLLAFQVQQQLLVGEYPHLAVHGIHLLAHDVRVGQDVVAIEHILQKCDQFLIQALHRRTNLAAVVIGEHQHIDDHTDAEADGRIPNTLQRIVDGLNIRHGTHHDHDKAGQRRRIADPQYVIKRDHQNHTDGSCHQRRNRQKRQHDSRSSAEQNTNDLGIAGIQRIPESRLDGRHGAQHGENQLGSAGAIGIHDHHSDHDRHSRFDGSETDMYLRQTFKHDRHSSLWLMMTIEYHIRHPRSNVKLPHCKIKSNPTHVTTGRVLSLLSPLRCLPEIC